MIFSIQAIFDMSMRCLQLRDDVSREDIDEFCSCLNPALLAAPRAAEENHHLGVAEGRLGLLFSDLYVICHDLSSKASEMAKISPAKGSLAQNLKVTELLFVTSYICLA